MNNCISIDWLQLHVLVPFRQFETIKSNYQIRRVDWGTKNFKSVFKIFELSADADNEENAFATLVSEPYSRLTMPENAGLIKIHNKYLYQVDLHGYVENLLKALQLTFVNITRLDIAYDFEKFDTIEPKEFIDRLVSDEYLKKEKADIKVMGGTKSVDKGKLTGGWNSLKFGKESSDITYYLYNKTLEMSQVKHKPWIADHWRSHGWKGDSQVWRLEFSTRPNQKVLPCKNEDGEIVMINYRDLSTLKYIEHIFCTYFNKYFSFVQMEYTKRGNVKKQSRSTPVVLFEHLKFNFLIVKLSSKEDSSRADKIFIKKLNCLNNELRGVDPEFGIIGDAITAYIVKSRDLKKWANKKINLDFDKLINNNAVWDKMIANNTMNLLVSGVDVFDKKDDKKFPVKMDVFSNYNVTNADGTTTTHQFKFKQQPLF